MSNSRHSPRVFRTTFLATSIALALTATAADQKHDDFYWLGEINKASAVMLVEQGIVPKPLGGQIANAVTQVIADAEKPDALRPGDYLKVEQSLIAIGGPDMTRIHSGRSRQDIGAASRRLFMREDLLDTLASLNNVRGTLLKLAAAHPDAIIPAYTWGVQAQPTSLGHYTLAYVEALCRDAERIRQAWARLNLSPLGAAALGTSSFPINRRRMAEFLGFDGLVENSLDANQISPVDAGAEVVSIAASSALTVNALLADLTAQYAQTKPWLVLAEGNLTGTSSIMPQKRNPTGIVELRTAASVVLGDAQTYLIMAHNVSAGMGDYKGDQPDKVMREAARMFDALAELMKSLTFDEKRALAEVNADYSTTTELANTLQRVSDVPFRVGHHFASELVNFGRSHNLKPAEIPYAEAQRIYTEAAMLFRMDKTRLPLDEAQFRRALTPENMVQASQGTGGPQSAEVARMYTVQTANLAADRDWLEGTRAKLAVASKRLDEAFGQLSSERLSTATVELAVAQEKTLANPKTASIEEALSAFLTAFENLDWRAFRACFSDTATIFHPAAPNIRRIDSPDQFEKAWLGVFERIKKSSGRISPPYMKLSPLDLRVEKLSEDVALFTFHLVDGSTVNRRTLVFKRDPDGWKIVHIHASNITAP